MVSREVVTVRVQTRFIEWIDENVASESFADGLAGKDHGGSAGVRGQDGESTPIFGQNVFMEQSGHFGLRAMQTCRPWTIMRWEKSTHSLFGSSVIRSCSIFVVSVCFVRPSRLLRRLTCVSTTTPVAIPNAVPRTTFA